MLNAIVITPAFGRKCETVADFWEQWLKEKDFQMRRDGRYINKMDFEKYGNAMDYLVFRPKQGGNVVIFHPKAL